jgi:hypothetical protein
LRHLPTTPHYTLITQRSQAIARTSHTLATTDELVDAADYSTPLCAAANIGAPQGFRLSRAVNVKKWGLHSNFACPRSGTPRASLQLPPAPGGDIRVKPEVGLTPPVAVPRLPYPAHRSTVLVPLFRNPIPSPPCEPPSLTDPTRSHLHLSDYTSFFRFRSSYTRAGR